MRRKNVINGKAYSIIMSDQLFRKKSIDKISSPEQLDDYLRVSTPALWLILSAIAAFLAGVIVWAGMAHLETVINTVGDMENQQIQVWLTGSDAEKVEAGMVMRVDTYETTIDLGRYDEYGRAIATGFADLPDGIYKVEIVTESIHPIRFLFR